MKPVQDITLSPWFEAFVIAGLFWALALAGCSTITPDSVKATSEGYDASTPSQYPNNSSGFLKFMDDGKGNTTGALITTNALRRYNNLIRDYRLQYRAEKKQEIRELDGVTPTRDEHGNDVYFMDDQRLQVFFLLSRWSKDQKPADSVWQKLKDKLTASEERNDAP